jgi:hypothetical protein
MTQAGAMAARLPRAGAAAFARFEALGPARRRAALASAVWVVLVAAYAIGFFGASAQRGTVFLDGAFFLVTLALPLILVWLAAFLAEELARQREMIAALAELAGPLAEALEGARASLDRHAPASPAELRRAVEGALVAARGADAGQPALERLLAGQTRIEAALGSLRAAQPAAPEAAAADRPRAPRAAAAGPSAARAAPPSRPRAAPTAAAAAAAGQADLPLIGAAEPEPGLAWDELMRAFDFPRDAEDAEGFRALRLALRHRSLAQMLQAAEDVLTYLSQEGIYVDELALEPPDPEAWRRFVAGERGAEVAAAGGLRDPQALEAARALMKSDPIFRDCALFFLRRFDTVLAEVAGSASDGELAELAGTRSGRAFALMARASGSFD